MTPLYPGLAVAALAATVAVAPAERAAAADLDGCRFEGIELKGKVKAVTGFSDIKVQIVDSFPDLKVQEVASFADDCGEWEMVDSFEDFSVEYVDGFPDIKIQMVSSFPGLP